MTNSSFTPDDPRLTAFALGELDGPERAEFEQVLESSEDAREALAAVQETIGLLRDELVAEPAPTLTDVQRAAVAMASSEASVAETSGTAGPDVQVATAMTGTPAWRSWRGMVATVTTAVALCLVLLALPRPEPSSMDAAIGGTDLQTPEILAYTSGDDFTEFEQANIPSEMQKLADRTGVAAGGGGFAGPGAVDIKNIEVATANVTNAASPAASAPLADSFGSRRQAPGNGIKGRTQDLLSGLELAAKRNLTEEDFAKEGRNNSPAKGNSAQLRPTAEPAQSPLNSRIPVATEAKRQIASQDRSAAEPQVTSLADSERPRPVDAPAEVGDSAGRNLQQLAGGKRKLSERGIINGTSLDGAAKPIARRAGQPGTGQPAGQPAAGRPGDGQPGDESSPGQPRPELSVPKPFTTSPLVASVVPASKAALPQPGTPQPGRKTDLSEVVADAPGESAPVPGFPVAANEARKIGQDALRFRRTRKLETEEEVDLGKKVSSLYFGAERAKGGWRYRQGEQSSKPLPRPNAYNEAYDAITENAFVRPRDEPLSTFSMDVDTASYANVRRFLDQGQFPPKNAVRVEELINYFTYEYPQPEGEDPFSVSIQVNICPWQPQHRLARVGLQAKTLEKQQRPPTNLVFLIDTSGSMRAENKLPLVRASMNMLVSELTEDDQVSIVTYSSTADLRLATTSGAKKPEIKAVIDGLNAGGSTNGAGGIQLAYDTAVRKYIDGGSNRVIVCTDGDFNVGISDDDKLVELIQEKAASGVFLSVFGFGMGNLKDAKLEKLADKGNGQYGYIDSQGEAKKVFSEELIGTLYTVAKDVKAQVEFNPQTVGAYRLIGYENRMLAARDFNDDTKDAGEIGAGHSVTALYEIIPKSVLLEQPGVDALKYQGEKAASDETKPGKKSEATSELFTLKLRYKLPDEETSKLTAKDYPVEDVNVRGEAVAPDNDFVWAAAVASFGMNLRESQHRGNFTFREVVAMAQRSVGDDEHGRRKDFIALVTKAARMAGQGGGLEAPVLEGPVPQPAEIESGAARVKAAVDGKYRRLLKKIEVQDDFRRFKAFHDYGYWDGTEYAGQKDLLPGYWVYVYPHWYIWGQQSEKDAPAAAETQPGGETPEPDAGSTDPGAADPAGDKPATSDPAPPKSEPAEG